MKEAKILFQTVGSPQVFYDQLKKQVPTPKTFGDNLDALFDFLTTDLKGRVDLTWDSYAADVKGHPELRSVRGVLLAAAAERPDLQLHWG
jgi:RNAse (barnase) inhibitor barstar